MTGGASIAGVPWPVAGTLGSAVANIALLVYLRSYRGRPGVAAFVGVIACQVAWCLAYGIGLLVYDPAVRVVLEYVTWVAVVWIGVFYLAFALQYTGRGHLLGAWWFRGLVGFGALSTGVVATNPLHHLLWSEFRVAPAFDSATVAYVHGPWVFVQYAALFLLSTFAVFVLLDTVVSYGPLYRTQAAAVALTPVPPAVAFTVWVFELGPVHPLNLTPIMFLPHIALDSFALFRSDMFEFHPSTRRAGERAAIDDLGDPVVVVDDKRRVVTLNGAAESLLGTEKRQAVTRRIGDLLGDEAFDPADPSGTVTVRRAGRRAAYRVSSTPLSDATGAAVGHTLVFQDVTAERRREQRLAVLNRVLRHNLRNDLNSVQGYLEIASDRVEDPEVESMLDIAESEAGDLVALGEKAREIERAVAGGGETAVPTGAASVLADVAEDVRRKYPAGQVRVDVPDGWQLRTDPGLLAAVFENLVENGLEHGGSRVTVGLVAGTEPGAETAVFEVRDDGPGIPETELTAIERGEETALEHGSGLGLWLVDWGVTALGGEVTFAADGDGTTVTVRLPLAGNDDVADDGGAPV